MLRKLIANFAAVFEQMSQIAVGWLLGELKALNLLPKFEHVCANLVPFGAIDLLIFMFSEL